MSTFSTCTSSTRPGSPTDGDVLFETDTKNIIVYDGTNWRGYANDGVVNTYPTNTKALDFDGSNDYVDISGASGLFNSATAFSISLWYYADAYGGGVFGGGTSGTNGFWIQNFASGDNFFFNLRNGATTFIKTTSPALNQWVHVAATFNAGNAALYLTPAGGSTATTTSASFPSSTSSTVGTNLSIGRLPPAIASSYHNGKIDEVAIWNREISSSEVSDIINNKSYLGVSAMWRLEDTADATIGGSGYDGTLNNFVSPNGFVTNTPY